MFVKRYIAPDMAKAMEKIRRELGPDAIILSQRPVRPKGFFGFFQKKLLEVMVACETPADKMVKPSIAPKEEKAQESPVIHDNHAANQEQLEEINGKLGELKSVVRQLTDKLITMDSETTSQFMPEVSQIYGGLIAQATRPDLAKRICQRVQDVLKKTDDDPRKVTETLLLEFLGESAPIKIKKYRQSVVMLIGPTGVGKTTTLVKLAGLFALNQGLKVGFINTDTYRVAAQEQIKTYAEIMDIPCGVVYSPDEMPDTIDSMQECDIIFIDTAGKSTDDPAYHQLIKDYIHMSGAQEILLTVSASTSHNVCKELFENYSFLPNYKLVITKLDEVKTYGHILNISDYAGMPVAYLTVGQNVPQDIEEPHFQRIINHILESAGV